MVAFLSKSNHWMPSYLTKCQKSEFYHFAILRHSTFHRITRLPEVVEGWKYHHSNRLVETNRMVGVSFLFEFWVPRYLIKCPVAQGRKMIKMKQLLYIVGCVTC